MPLLGLLLLIFLVMINVSVDSANSAKMHLGPDSPRNPEAAFGFFHLDESYHEAVAPEKAVAMAQMEPVFVMRINSLTRQMGLEIKMLFVWEDPRITWKKKDNMTIGSKYSFNPSVLKFVTLFSI